MKEKVFIAAIALLMLWPCVSAQQNVKENYIPIFLYEDEVKPSMYFEYMEAVKSNMQFFKDNNYKYPVYTFRDDEFNVFFNTPMGPNIAYVDSIYKELGIVAKADSIGWEKVWKNYDGTYNHGHNYIVYWSKSRSYYPVEIHDNLDEYKYTTLAIIYPMPGKMRELKKIMEEWVALYKSNNIQQGFDTYPSYMGTKERIWVVMRFKDEIDAAQKLDGIRTVLMKSEDYQNLYKKTLKVVQKWESSRAWYLPEYSYIPE
ncbi:hypothetical protein [Carboxylicivirga sp. RSCT41]|uniref:hypothetical protein n=1 Tax=Carboxylicivirga agarovorans TaxID=3417570 RepID=UPI003D339CE2